MMERSKRDVFVTTARAAVLCAVTMVVGCVDDHEDLPVDPREMTHEQLLAGSALVEVEAGHGLRVLRVGGAPYQMGYQQGALLRAELEEFRETVEDDIIWSSFVFIATQYGPGDGATYLEHARAVSLPSVIDECEGMVAGSEEAMTFDLCLIQASITYIMEDLVPRHFPAFGDTIGCTGFVALGDATADGAMLHGRNLDYTAIDTIMEHPIVHVRAPTGGVRHVVLSWPGTVAALTGMNEVGLTGEVNENRCPSEDFRDMAGVPAEQQLVALLAGARDLGEAESLAAATDQGACQMLVLSHGPSRDAVVIEQWGRGQAVRRLADSETSDLIWATNHFEHPDADASQQPRDTEDLDDNSVSRFTRVRERLVGSSLPPHPGLGSAAPDFVYGRLDVGLAVDLLRDNVDLRPDQDRRMFPCTEHAHGNWAIGNNNNIHSVVMRGESLELWFSAGWDEECGTPLYSPFVGFSLPDLFDGDAGARVLPTLDPPFNDRYGSALHEER
jgi:hypothetical protein